MIFLCIMTMVCSNVGLANACRDNFNYPHGCHCINFDEYPHEIGSDVSLGCTFQCDVLLHSVPTRFGEADNPGPLRVGTFNPVQLLGNEKVVADWGPGIWGASETSHTPAAIPVSSKAFRNLGLNSVWSKPVACLKGSFASLRGKASGTAIASDLPLARYPVAIPPDVDATSRLVETIVHSWRVVCPSIRCTWVVGPFVLLRGFWPP